MKTTTVWKWTDSNNKTKNGTQWGEGVTHTAPGGGELCTAAYLHAYADPLLAVAFRPIHVDGYSVLWQGTADVEKDDGTKLGCTRVTTEKIVETPKILVNAVVRWAIYCTKVVYQNAAWLAWADGWLSGADRSSAAAADADLAVVVDVVLRDGAVFAEDDGGLNDAILGDDIQQSPFLLLEQAHAAKFVL